MCVCACVHPHVQTFASIHAQVREVSYIQNPPKKSCGGVFRFRLPRIPHSGESPHSRDWSTWLLKLGSPAPGEMAPLGPLFLSRDKEEKSRQSPIRAPCLSL